MPETLEEAQAAYEEEMQEDDAEEFLKELKEKVLLMIGNSVSLMNVLISLCLQIHYLEHC